MPSSRACWLRSKGFHHPRNGRTDKDPSRPRAISINILFFLTFISVSALANPVEAGGSSPVEELVQQVPSAVLESDLNAQSSQVGTFCWTFPNLLIASKVLCVDTFALLTDSEPLRVQPAEKLRIDLPDLSESANVDLCWIHDPVEAGNTDDPAVSAWITNLERCSSYTNVSSMTISSPIETGLYAISVYAAWPDTGNAQHGFLILVEEPH